ncbi:hypothetical protein AOQ71_26070 [Bradyrhizobium manausense]|uniref:Uncharacterized protein n=1 Tax=Bradyrhizobium manausense TaxID=989370 RepID=A0A0R3D8Z6_9BRAD|nr:hypothetical protein AOQ71_26070 [Bradyrhizobium manausense]
MVGRRGQDFTALNLQRPVGDPIKTGRLSLVMKAMPTRVTADWMAQAAHHALRLQIIGDVERPDKADESHSRTPNIRHHGRSGYL